LISPLRSDLPSIPPCPGRPAIGRCHVPPGQLPCPLTAPYPPPPGDFAADILEKISCRDFRDRLIADLRVAMQIDKRCPVPSSLRPASFSGIRSHRRSPPTSPVSCAPGKRDQMRTHGPGRILAGTAASSSGSRCPGAPLDSHGGISWGHLLGLSPQKYPRHPQSVVSPSPDSNLIIYSEIIIPLP